MPSKSNEICVPCEKEMQPVKVGVLVEEHMDDGSPYKIWQADLLGCPKCGHQIIAGFANSPVAHHHDSHYSKVLKEVELHIR